MLMPTTADEFLELLDSGLSDNEVLTLAKAHTHSTCELCADLFESDNETVFTKLLSDFEGEMSYATAKHFWQNLNDVYDPGSDEGYYYVEFSLFELALHPNADSEMFSSGLEHLEEAVRCDPDRPQDLSDEFFQGVLTKYSNSKFASTDVIIKVLELAHSLRREFGICEQHELKACEHCKNTLAQM